MKQLLQARKKIFRETPAPNHDSLTNSKSKASPSSRKLQTSRNQSKENESPSHADLNSPYTVPAPKIEKPPLPRYQLRNPLKRKHGQDLSSDVSSSADSGVQVIVRVRPLNKDEENEKRVVQKISECSLSVGGQTFTFDSVADHSATQEEVFQLVGVPLVENCLSGFNSSVFAYGQTGSGKTYTMWGPSTSACKDSFRNDQHGLMPRIFQRLFSRINEEQGKHADTQLNYNCRCSFLEIYNEQITDLLDPGQKNLQIREDVKCGVYVENLKEEYVFAIKDVMRLLLKGLSNRKTGSTSLNTESSRSHSVFTCVVESRCKRKPDGISILKVSRINLVDLAGSERQKLTGAAGDRLKEAGNINRSLSQLGNLINILAEVSQTGKQRHIPYRDSRLTFLLQESLGGNAKLAMVCAVSPSLSCQSESFSTLRFAQRAKAIKNKAVVNEETKEDVNHLREIIHQLRDELHRVKKTNEGSSTSSELDLRKSLSLLKTHIPLNARLPLVDEDGDEEMEIDEEAVENATHPIISTSPKMRIGSPEDENEAKSRGQRKRKSIALRRSSVKFLFKNAAKSDVDDAPHKIYCANCELLEEKLDELTRQNKILKGKMEAFQIPKSPSIEIFEGAASKDAVEDGLF